MPGGSATAVEYNQTLMEVEHTPPMHKKILDLMPGISGGVARVLVGQPFDTIKTRLQVMGTGTALAAKLPPSDVYANSMDCFRKMAKNEGYMSVYKGTVAPLIGNMALLGIHFPTFNRTRAFIEGDSPKEFSYLNVYAAGGVAGAAGSLVSCPVELIRTKMQMMRKAMLLQKLGEKTTAELYNGSWDCFKQVVGKHGIKGLYRGYTSTLLRDIQGYGFFFLGYEATVNFLANGRSKAELNYMEVMGAGIMAGFGLWGSMFPIDTIKSKMQADILANPQYKNTMDCIRQTLATEGQAGLWRGFTAALWRGIPVNAAIFLAVEGTRELINSLEEPATIPATASS